MDSLQNDAYRYDLLLDITQYCTIPPPVEEQTIKKTPREIFPSLELVPLTPPAIRSALLKWVKKKTLLSSKAAREMVFTSIRQEAAYYYSLETFAEHRAVCTRYQPHTDKIFRTSGPKDREEPAPWDLSASPAKMFQNQVQYIRIPGTDVVKGCPGCRGQKWTPCSFCQASGKVRCPVCHGSGWSSKRRLCWGCNGQRLVPCAACMALGRVCCETCIGKGQLSYFRELRVEHKCYLGDHIHSTANIPEHLLPSAPGEILYESTAEKLHGFSTSTVDEINSISQRLVEESRRTCSDCRIIQQRQMLKAVPVTQVQYYWKDKSGTFFIYGSDHCIYCNDYPKKKIICCTQWF